MNFEGLQRATTTLLILSGLTVGSVAHGYTRSGTTLTTDGSLADVTAAVAAAAGGDTVKIPAGTFVWGDNASSVTLNKPITLSGTSQQTTIIQLSPTGPTGNSAVIRLAAAGAVVRSLSIKAPATGNAVTVFSTSAASGWRITDVKYDATGKYSYFARVTSSAPYGLIDNCTVIGGGGANELIFAEGPTNSWQTPNSFGTADNLFVEDCVFAGSGYVCDINNNGRAVLRFNRIDGQNKIDGHGYASNSLRGVRHMEIYGNRWTAAASSWVAMELRGGGLRVWGNKTDHKGGVSVFFPSLILTDYLATSNAFTGSAYTFLTPADYPITDQIGVGMDPKVGGSEPAYLWNNIAGTVSHSPGVDWTISSAAVSNITGTTDAAGYPIGATKINVTAQSARISSTDYVKFDGDANYYQVDTTKNSGAGVLVLKSPGLLRPIATSATSFVSGPNVRYQVQTGVATATFSILGDIIKAGRDYFKHTTGAPVDSATGIGIGTYAEMQNLTPSKAGVGFWVTDEANWNSKNSGNDGQLYVWKGSAWERFYTPYSYPHPLREGKPVIFGPYFK